MEKQSDAPTIWNIKSARTGKTNVWYTLMLNAQISYAARRLGPGYCFYCQRPRNNKPPYTEPWVRSSRLCAAARQSAMY